MSELGPVGIGDFTGSAPPGAGSGAPYTDAALDVMLSVDLCPNAGFRLRLEGFDHQMPLQDIHDSIGGEQANSIVHGGRRAWGISNDEQAYRLIAIAGAGSTGSGPVSLGAITLQAFKRDLTDLENSALALGPSENVLALMNGNANVALLKGNGDLVITGQLSTSDARETWTAAITCEHGSIALNYSVCSASRMPDGTVCVSGFLNVGSVSSPSGWVRISNLPYPIASGTESYRPVALRMQNLNAASGAYQGYGYIGNSFIALERLLNGVSVDCAADFKAGSQIMFSMTYKH